MCVPPAGDLIRERKYSFGSAIFAFLSEAGGKYVLIVIRPVRRTL
jgi:hypothetical protein